MKNLKKIIATAVVAIALGAGLTACSTDADVASHNLSTDAEQFKIERRIVFFNGITDKYLLTIEGRCSVESGEETMLAGALEVTCKLGPDKYKKHFLGLSDNVSYFVEQTESADVDPYRYEVIFKPEEIAPDIRLKTSLGADD